MNKQLKRLRDKLKRQHLQTFFEGEIERERQRMRERERERERECLSERESENEQHFKNRKLSCSVLSETFCKTKVFFPQYQMRTQIHLTTIPSHGMNLKFTDELILSTNGSHAMTSGP